VSGLQTVDQFSSLTEEKIGIQLGKGLFTVAALQNRTGDYRRSQNGASRQVQLWGGGGSCYDDPNTFLCTAPAVFDGGVYTVQQPAGYSINSVLGYNRDYSLGYVRPLGDRYQLRATYVSSFITQD